MKNEKHQLPPLSSATYEEWLLDHLEGRLSASREAELHVFLKQHPQLKEELEGLRDVVLHAEELPFTPSWEGLKKAPEPFSELSLNDYKMVAVLEGDAPLESLDLSNPGSVSDWKNYQRTKLQAGSEVFMHKSRLRRRTLRAAYLWQSAAAAAAVLAFVVFQWWTPSEPLTTAPLLVQQSESIGDSDKLEPESAAQQDAISPPINVKDPEQHETTTATDNPKHYLAMEETEEDESLKTALPLISGITRAQIPQKELPDAYEEGLRHMLPTYIENHHILAKAPQPESSIPVNTQGTSRLTDRAALLLKSVNPLNLEYERVFDEDGQLVAVNLGNEHFDLSQRVPRWIGSRISND